TPLAMTSLRLAGSVGLTAADFGVWTIRDVLAAPMPANAITTYGAFAGGTALPGSLPGSGTVVFNGSMAGVIATTTVGGSDDATGTVSLTVDFAAGTVTGSISSIATTPGVSTLTPYSVYAPAIDNPFRDMVISGGVISGNSFTATVTSPTIPSATHTTLRGTFYGTGANELAGTFVLSDPSPGPGKTFIGAFGAKP
ncbi:MAG TPA: transferrin-binding protein-like solute binding protein, partial [Fluviicoccus sp.]|nr:transferrin-binding protein-like solute binding protein [Fluviicoccus sp.]